MNGLQAVRVVGGIVPPSMLARVQSGEVAPESLTPSSYRLAGNETLRDAAARAWSYLLGAWTAFREKEEPTTSQTRERWLLPLVRELGYGNVPSLSNGLSIDETHYPISHSGDHVPIHLLAPSVFLDRRNPGVAGAARAPQAMLQEYLNRSDDHLWALLSNGTRLRMLRDSTALAGSAYLEFDLEAIFDGELYSEFLLMFLVAHSTRTEKRGGNESSPADCWLEAWRSDAVDTGTRALDKLRVGVEKALTELGDGFLHHPNNGWLVAALRNGELSDRDYLRALLRLVYRLLFCFVAEDRNALLDPQAPPDTKDRYGTYFSTARLRRISRIRSGGPHPDLWEAQRLVLLALGGQGLAQLAVPALGGLFDPDPRAKQVQGQPGPDLLLVADLSNHAFLSAIRALAWVQVSGGRTQPVDYRNLGAEELGSVYESLLELIPRVDLTDMVFRLETLAGHDRKTTGSYYTPPALVSALLDTALDPLLNEAVKNADDAKHAEQRLLAMTVCDPASGSGGFLVAAARRIARRLAQIRSGEDEPTPEQVQHALRDVIGRCIYGVDINDLAAELAKVSLWLEALEPGKPLGFLDARIRVGNSLMGATPAQLAEGIPDSAFKDISGDDKKYAASIRKQNKIERTGQSSLFAADGTIASSTLTQARKEILSTTDDVNATRDKATAWQYYQESDQVRHAHLQADAWTAGFVWPLTQDAPVPVTQETLLQIAADPDNPTLADTVAEVDRLAHEYRFFHWHLEFPEAVGGDSQFDLVLGNPPWERLALEEKAFFAGTYPEIAEARTAERRSMIAELATVDPAEFDRYQRSLREHQAIAKFVSESGHFEKSASGRLNYYPLFVDLARQTARNVALIVPSGIISDTPMGSFWSDPLTSIGVRSFFDFSNEEGIFEGVHRQQRFGLLSLGDRSGEPSAFSFGNRRPEILAEPVLLSVSDLFAIDPIAGQPPTAASERELDVLATIRRHSSSAGTVGYAAWVGATSEGWAQDIEDSPGEGLTDLIEAKMIWQFDWQYATYEGTDESLRRSGNPRAMTDEDRRSHVRPQGRYWVPIALAEQFLTRKVGDATWFAVVRDVTNPTNERTAIATVIPRCLPVQPLNGVKSESPLQAAFFACAVNSLPCDFTARRMITGNHLNVTNTNLLPIPTSESTIRGYDWIGAAAILLASQLPGLSVELGAPETPIDWDPKWRWRVRCELDAWFLHQYGLSRSQAETVLDSFPLLEAHESRVHGRYVSRETVLEHYDRMSSEKNRGREYTPLYASHPSLVKARSKEAP